MMSTMMAIERQLSMGHEQGGPLVQWLNLPAWKIYCGSRIRAPTGIQVSKIQIVTFSLTCKDLILWGASVTET